MTGSSTWRPAPQMCRSLDGLLASPRRAMSGSLRRTVCTFTSRPEWRVPLPEGPFKGQLELLRGDTTADLAGQLFVKGLR